MLLPLVIKQKDEGVNNITVVGFPYVDDDIFNALNSIDSTNTVVNFFLPSIYKPMFAATHRQAKLISQRSESIV
jgi:hypothetical protein